MKPKFSKAEKAEILSRYYSNNTEVKALAAQYGISRQTIYNWTKGKRRPSIIVPATARPAPNWSDVRILKMQLEREKRIREILQCADVTMNSSIKAKLKAMEELYKEDPVKYNIHILCDAVGVTRRFFYGHGRYNKRDTAWFKTRIPALKECIRDIFNENEQRFGADKITVIMKERGLHVSVAMVRRLMREMSLHGIRTGAKRRWRLEIRNPVDHVKQQFKSARDFIKSLADYIDFYNTKRPHEATRMMTPAEKERHYDTERKKTVNRSLHKGVRVKHLFRQ